MSKHVLVVAGARPNFMKVAPILRELDARGVRRTLVHTGQHYDQSMSETFFQELGLPNPDYHLEVGSGSHAQQTARVLSRFEPVLLESRPNWVVVVGDVNSTLACAIATAKLRSDIGCGLAHVEAGLRSGDWRMPEEINRVVTDRVSDLLLTPSRDAEANLVAEGLPREKISFAGNVMIDTLRDQLPLARTIGMHHQLGVKAGGFALVTIHRPSNVDSPVALRTIVEAFNTIASARMPIVFPVHPRTRAKIEELGTALHPNVRMTAPLGYRQMLSLTEAAAVVLTDSGGLQEETTALSIPCVTLREQTERPITLTEGTNRLAPWPLSIEGIVRAHEDAASRHDAGRKMPEGWDGRAAHRIVTELLNRHINA